MKPKQLISLPIFGLFAFAAILPVAVLPVRADTAAQSDVRSDAPPIPTAPRTIPFSERVAGRHLVYDARDVYQTTPTVAFTARWTVRSSNAPGSADDVDRGTETISAELAARRFSLMSEATDSNGIHTVRRAFTRDGQLTATLFQERTSGKTIPLPKREVTHVPVDEGETVQRALQKVRIEPVTRAANLLVLPILPDMRRETQRWREASTQTINGTRAELVDEVDPPEGQGNNVRLRARRYAFDAATRRLLRFEMWQVTKNPDRARPARGKRPADDGVRMTYRREDYTNITLSTAPLPAATYALTVPANYVEKAPPGGDTATMAPPPSPDLFDPKAMALLDRWRRSQERFLTLKTEIDASYAQTERTDTSRPVPPQWRDTRLHYVVTVEKPSKARIVTKTVAGGGFRGRFGRADNQTAVSNGENVRTVTDGNVRTVPYGRREDSLWNGLSRAGLNDWLDAISPIFEAPPDVANRYNKVSYDGPAVLPGGEPVEVVTLTRDISTTARRGRGADTSITVQISFGRDGMPRKIEQHRVTEVPGLYVGDQPPKLTIVIEFKNLALDTEPTSTAFILPTEKG